MDAQYNLLINERITRSVVSGVQAEFTTIRFSVSSTVAGSSQYTLLFNKPYKKQFSGVRSGEPSGHRNSRPRPIHGLKNCLCNVSPECCIQRARRPLCRCYVTI